ncbi:hypothetical protein GGI11_002446, partial [Coemansia sp. RSA 2049]
MTQTSGNASTAAMDLLKEKLDKIIVRELPFTYKEYIDISDTINKQVLDPDIKPPFLSKDVKNAESIAQTYRGRRMHNWFIAYITRFAKSLAAEASNYTDGALLCFYTRKWSHFYLNSRAVGRLFVSVEIEWIAVERKFNPEFPTIEETMYQLWYLHFVCAISNRLSGAVMCLLQLEQKGHVADRSVLESAWHAFSDSFARVYGHQPAKLFAEYCNISLNKHRAARLIDCRELVADQDLEAQALNEIQQLQAIISSFNNKFELFMYYEMLLARRLVSNQYISLELERRALQDLKLSHILVGHADSSFRMISDKIGSDAITQKFIDCLARNSSDPQPAKVDISVCVFGSSIVDFDKGLVGSAVTQALLMQNQPEDHTRPLWQARSQDSDIGGEFGSVNSVREWVRLNGWAALVIHSNATQQLETALAQNGDNAKNYNQNDAMTLFVSSGHHPVVSIQIVEPATTADLGKATYAFAVSMVQEIQKGRISIPPLLTAASASTSTSSDADSSSNNSNLAGIIAQPISYRQIDVAPFTFGIGPISYLFSFLVGMLCTIGPMIGWKMSTFTFYLKVRHRDLWLAAVALLFAWTAYMGMLGALAFSAFRGPGYSEVALKYTVGRFFSLWATITITLMAVSVWLFCWFVLVPPEILGLASLVTILPNTMSTLVIAELAPHFFRWIHALPFYNGAMLYRYILSGAYPQIGANVGIILGEICVMSLTLWVVIWIRQHMVLDGTSDAAGWSYGSIFFYSPVPHHKKKRQAAEEFTT